MRKYNDLLIVYIMVILFTYLYFFPLQTTDQNWIPCLHDETEKLVRKVKEILTHGFGKKEFWKDK